MTLLVAATGCAAQLGGDGPSGGKADGPNNGLGPDAGVASVDASTQPQPDASPSIAPDNACGVASDQGDLGTIMAVAGTAQQGDSSSKRVYWVEGTIPSTASQATPDLMLVELWDDYGAFDGGSVRTGTFTLSGVETDYDTCGICVLIGANVGTNGASKLLLATAGTVTITSIATAAGQTTRATVTNATFTEISYTEGNGYSPVAGSNCPSPLARGELAGTL